MIKLEIGDKVRVNPLKTDGVIASIDGDYIHVDIVQEDGTGARKIFIAQELEPIEAAKEEAEDQKSPHDADDDTKAEAARQGAAAAGAAGADLSADDEESVKQNLEAANSTMTDDGGKEETKEEEVA